MILSDTAIFEALDDGRLVISPEPAPRLQKAGGPPSPYATCSVDLTLAPTLLVPNQDLAVTVDFRHGSVPQTLAAISERHDLNEREYKLEAGKFILGQTSEVVTLPLAVDFRDEAKGKRGLAARVEGKSSCARFGLLIHFTAPTIHAGWSGPIALEMINLGPVPILLYPGMPVCQLILEETVGDPQERRSQFHDQGAPSGLRS